MAHGSNRSDGLGQDFKIRFDPLHSSDLCAIVVWCGTLPAAHAIRLAAPNKQPTDHMDYLDFPNNKPSRHLRQKRRDKRLAEELIECRRYCGGDSNKKTREKGATKRNQKNELLGYHPPHEPICVRRRAHFTDNLEPLERFLRSHVGRPWSAVYAELKGQLDGGSVTGQHVIQHLEDYMGHRYRHRPVEEYRSRNDGVSLRFAVHPDTGLLCIADPRTPLPEGPFPQKARFKKEKARRKSRLRLGLEEKTRPQKQQPEAKDWLRRFFVDHIGGVNCYNFDTELHRVTDFWENDWRISLALYEATGVAPKRQPELIWVAMKHQPDDSPFIRFRGRLSMQCKSGTKPQQVSFTCIWHRTAGDFFMFEVLG